MKVTQIQDSPGHRYYVMVPKDEDLAIIEALYAEWPGREIKLQDVLRAIVQDWGKRKRAAATPAQLVAMQQFLTTRQARRAKAEAHWQAYLDRMPAQRTSGEVTLETNEYRTWREGATPKPEGEGEEPE